MKIGEFRFLTPDRSLAACLATMGVPFKQSVPITNEYSENRPVPQVPCGHPSWRPGRVTWHFESISDTWEHCGRPILPKDITVAFRKGEEANNFAASIKQMDGLMELGDINLIRREWLLFRESLPFVIAGYINTALENYRIIWLPMLKKAWTQITTKNGEGDIHTSTNPTNEVREKLL